MRNSIKYLLSAIMILAHGFNPETFAQVNVTATLGTTTGSFTTVTSAFDAINAGTHKGEIIITISGNTTEPTSAILNASNSGSASYTTITLYPTVAGVVISGNIAGPLIRLNGADNVTIDGREGQTGTTASMTLENTGTSNTTSTCTVELINDACENEVQYCNLLGSSTATYGGIVYFSTSGSGEGNDYNMIQYNNITSSATNRPVNAVCSLGSTGGQENSDNYITGNSIFNVIRTNGNSFGVYLGSGNVGWEVASNSFYETSALSFSANAMYFAIFVDYASGNTFNLANNFIGGSAASCGGDPLSKSGSDVPFYGIYLNAGTTPVSNVNGNTISNISWINSASSAFYGIYLAGGTMNAGTDGAGNIIGAATGTGSIIYSAGGAGDFYGLYVAGSSSATAIDNAIGAVTVANSSGGATNFYGICHTSNAASSFTGNTIGSTVTPGSINANSSSLATAQVVYGIFSSGSNTGTGNTFSGNTVANLLNGTANTATATAGFIHGIDISAGKNSISGNSVFNLTIGNNNTATNNQLSAAGIVVSASSSGAAQTVNGNTVYGVKNTYFSLQGSVAGLYFSAPTSQSNQVHGNFIYSIEASGGNNTGAVYGIRLDAGNTTVYNNIVGDWDNNRAQLFGIYEPGTAGSTYNIYFNTVYFAGASCINNAYGLYSAGNSSARVFKNNILNNNRSGNTSDHKQYAIFYNYASSGSLTTDYNDYYVSGSYSYTGHFNGSDISSLADLRTALGQDVNSLANNPLFEDLVETTATTYYPYYPLAGVAVSGITTDFSGTTRNTTTPCMGAIEAEVFVNWTGAISTNWSVSGNWSSGRVPHSTTNITIPAAPARKPVVTTSLPDWSYCGNLTIDAGATVTIPAGSALHVNGTLTNNAGNAGLLLESSASGTAQLIHYTTGVSATVQRYIAGPASWADGNKGWHFLSSPVAAQVISPAFTVAPPENYDFYAWWELSDLWVNYKNSSVAPTWSTANVLGATTGGDNFIPGKGYLAAYASTSTKSFAGALNVSNIAVSGLTNTGSAAYKGWNLLGNPFPCPLTWNAAGNTWGLSNIDAACQIWKEAIASYVVIGAESIIPGNNGFMVHVTAEGSGSLTIPASSRDFDTASWYKSANAEENRIKLMAIDLAGQTAQETIIAFNPEATEDFDPLCDSYFLAGHAPMFFSVSKEKSYALNCLPLLNNNLVIPLSFIKNSSSDFTIELMKSIPGKSVYLTDLKLNKSQNLTNEPVYAFSSSSTDSPERFQISFIIDGTAEETKPAPSVYTWENSIYVRNQGISELQVYNLTGQTVFSERIVQKGLYRAIPDLREGFYIVRLTGDYGVMTRKIYINSL